MKVKEYGYKPEYVDFKKHLTESDIETLDWYFSADIGMCLKHGAVFDKSAYKDMFPILADAYFFMRNGFVNDAVRANHLCRYDAKSGAIWDVCRNEDGSAMFSVDKHSSNKPFKYIHEFQHELKYHNLNYEVNP